MGAVNPIFPKLISSSLRSCALMKVSMESDLCVRLFFLPPLSNVSVAFLIATCVQMT